MKQKACWFSPLREQIIQQMVLAIDHLGGEDELITAIAGWGGVLTDEEVLKRLIAYNTKKLIPDLEIHCERVRQMRDKHAAESINKRTEI